MRITGLLYAVFMIVLVVCTIQPAESQPPNATIRRHGHQQSGAPHSHDFRFLTNGIVRIGVDIPNGGAIGYFSLANQDNNTINISDLGRYLGPDYYAGPVDFINDGHRPFSPWRWNPITPGDCFGHSAKLLEYRNDGKSIYVKTRPMQWGGDNIPGDCIFETKISLEGRAAHVWNRLISSRQDHTQYGPQTQELPALITAGRFDRIVSYGGLFPFTNAPVEEFTDNTTTLRGGAEIKTIPGAKITASENWAALLDHNGFGVGVFNPDVYTYACSFRGQRNLMGVGGPLDPQGGFIGAHIFELLDHNIVFDFDYWIILGNVNEIRRFVYQHRPKDRLPDYFFKKDRRHWVYAGIEDNGFPPGDGLSMTVKGKRPFMVGPDQWWQAKDVPKIYIRAAYSAQPGVAQLFWRVPGPSDQDNADLPPRKRISGQRSITFPFVDDAQFHTYEIDLASMPTYNGIISGLDFSPSTTGRNGDRVQIQFISRKNYAPTQPTIKVKELNDGR